jgi:4-hydroxy-4-methyl-2-oxoglutarate aldolase
VRWMETDYIDEDPYGQEIDAIDSLQPGDVVVHSTDYSGTNAPWGELMSTLAKRNGAVGCVCDSQIRDCVRIIEMGFPIYYTGIRPVDSMGRGKVMAADVPVRCGEVLVQPGDLVFADFDGIVVIPKRIEDEVIGKAEEKIQKENLSRRDLLAGKSLKEVYATYGVL